MLDISFDCVWLMCWAVLACFYLFFKTFNVSIPKGSTKAGVLDLDCVVVAALMLPQDYAIFHLGDLLFLSL